MEYIQTVLFQIPADRIEEASQAGGVLSRIDEHRSFLREQPGFLGMRVTRSVNAEGNILVVAETRWADDHSLVRYETFEPTLATIVREHERTLVPDSLQVLDMEALRTEASYQPVEAAVDARARVLMPLLIPAGVLAFSLLIIWGLSRVYLALPNEAAVGLAAGIAIGILLVAWYFAANPNAPGWHIGGVLVVSAVVLAGGTVWAVATDDDDDVIEPTPTPVNDVTPPPPDELVILMGDNYFEFEGERDPTITVPANEEITFELPNIGLAIHNMHVATADGVYIDQFCDEDSEVACSDPPLVPGGQDATITFTLEPGTYPFRCDFHPVEMIGTLVAE
jgi:plastocyanin/heme-degrading monooxygenase HmoA